MTQQQCHPMAQLDQYHQLIKMIQEILQQAQGNLFKITIATVGVVSIILHILPKGESKSGFFGFIGESMKFIKNIFKK